GPWLFGSIVPLCNKDASGLFVSPVYKQKAGLLRPFRLAAYTTATIVASAGSTETTPIVQPRHCPDLPITGEQPLSKPPHSHPLHNPPHSRRESQRSKPLVFPHGLPGSRPLHFRHE